MIPNVHFWWWWGLWDFWVPYFQTHLVKTSFSWLLPRPSYSISHSKWCNCLPSPTVTDGNLTRFKVTITFKRLLFCGLSKIDHDCDWNRSDKIEGMHSTNLTRAFRQHWTVAWRCAAGKHRLCGCNAAVAVAHHGCCSIRAVTSIPAQNTEALFSSHPKIACKWI